MEICSVLLAWAITLSDLDRVSGCPEIRPVPHAWLEAQACNGRSCKVLGWYPGSGDVVYIDKRLDIEQNLFHTSIVVHEMVHWLQGKTGALLQDCDQSIDAEREAYAVQQAFLARHGTYHPVGSVVPMLRCKPVDPDDLPTAGGAGAPPQDAPNEVVTSKANTAS